MAERFTVRHIDGSHRRTAGPADVERACRIRFENPRGRLATTRDRNVFHFDVDNWWDGATVVRRLANGNLQFDRYDGVTEEFGMDGRSVTDYRLRTPAEPGDVRFEVSDTEDGETIVLTVDEHGAVIDRNRFDTRSAAFDMIEAHREHQALLVRADREGMHPFELAMQEEALREREER